MPFWLVYLTEHEVIATHRTRSTAYIRVMLCYRWLLDNCTRLVDSLKQTVDASNFPTIVRQLTQRPPCTIPFCQIEILN